MKKELEGHFCSRKKALISCTADFLYYHQTRIQLILNLLCQSTICSRCWVHYRLWNTVIHSVYAAFLVQCKRCHAKIYSAQRWSVMCCVEYYSQGTRTTQWCTLLSGFYTILGNQYYLRSLRVQFSYWQKAHLNLINYENIYFHSSTRALILRTKTRVKWFMQNWGMIFWLCQCVVLMPNLCHN